MTYKFIDRIQPKGGGGYVVGKVKRNPLKIWDNHDFLLTAKICLKTDEQRQELADAIEKRWATNSDEVLAYVLAIYHDAPFKSEKL